MTIACHPARADELTAAKKDDILKLMAMVGATQAAEQAGLANFQSMRQSLRNCTNCTTQTFDVMERETVGLFHERLNAPGGLMDRMIALYDKHFSHREIQQILAFYTTPVGKRLTVEAPRIIREGSLINEHWAQSLAPELEKRIKLALNKTNLPLPASPQSASK
ncbi:MAG: hypothetical protein JWM03_673 [Rhodocyclales bacterium]|nr:hypothetical protein [Rhodocyclales bacterium]MDB5887801.1 hypothetical protein [Rhodocyclales bacterium]